MPDITMCLNDACKKRFRCYRYTAAPNGLMQSVANFEPDESGVCKDFWPNQDATKEDLPDA